MAGKMLTAGRIAGSFLVRLTLIRYHFGWLHSWMSGVTPGEPSNCQSSCNTTRIFRTQAVREDP